jgi:hypothetical protein
MMNGSGPTARPAIFLWRAAAVPAAVVGAVVAAGSAFWGTSALLSALFGAVLVLAAMSLGPVLMIWVEKWSPPAVMAAGVMGYGGAVLVLGLAFALTEPLTWLSGTHVGVAAVLVCLGWTAGHWRGLGRVRMFAYGNGTEGDDAPGAPVESGSPASPFERLR